MREWGLILLAVLFVGCLKSFPHPTGPPPMFNLSETLEPTEAPPDDSMRAYMVTDEPPTTTPPTTTSELSCCEDTSPETQTHVEGCGCNEGI